MKQTTCDKCKRQTSRLYNELKMKLCRACWDYENSPTPELDRPEYHTEEAVRFREFQRELEAEPMT